MATTANVDYQVSGDGTAIWNLSNPCGFFRQAGECVYESPLEPLEANATLTKEVVVDNPFDGSDELEPLAGVLVSYEGWDDNDFYVTGSGITGANGTVTFAVPAGDEYSIELESLPAAPDGYEYSGDMGDSEIVVAANGATTVTNILTLEIAEGTGTLTKILDLGIFNGEDGPLPTNLVSEVYFCPVVDDLDAIDALEDCIATAVVTAGYGENGQATNTVSADVPAGAYTICTLVEVEFDGDDGDLFTANNPCESTFTDDNGDEQPIVVLAGAETIVVNDFDAQTLGRLEVYVRNDDTDLPIAGASVCFFDADGNPIFNDCPSLTTSISGMVAVSLPGGTYTISVSAEGYEMESSTFVYSPLADAADGSVEDTGMGSDYVSALDPLPSVLDIFSTHDGAPYGMVYYVYDADPADDTEFCGLNGPMGPYIVWGFIDSLNGEAEEVLPAGNYCVQSVYLIGGGGPAFIATTVTLDAGDPDDDVDVLHARTGADPVGP